MIGLFYEMGPIKLTQQGIVGNPDTWAKNSSMLFIDSPAGTGFSFVHDPDPVRPYVNGTSFEDLKILGKRIDRSICSPRNVINDVPKWTKGYAENQQAISMDLMDFLDSFYEIFPDQQSAALYLTGESYAGKYIPSLAYEIDKRNNQKTHKRINMVGISIGDGFTDPISQVKYHAQLGLALGLISSKHANLMNEYAELAIVFMCADQYQNALDARTLIFDLFSDATGGINWYDIRRDSGYDRKDMIDFLRDTSVIKSLNLPVGSRNTKSSDVFAYLADDIMKSSAAYLPFILDAGYKVLLYQGQFDFRDGILGSTEWIDGIKWKKQEHWKVAEREVWRTQEINETHIAGYTTKVDNLVRVELLGAGHLAPGDQGYNSNAMMNTFLLDNRHPSTQPELPQLRLQDN